MRLEQQIWCRSVTHLWQLTSPEKSPRKAGRENFLKHINRALPDFAEIWDVDEIYESKETAKLWKSTSGQIQDSGRPTNLNI